MEIEKTWLIFYQQIEQCFYFIVSVSKFRIFPSSSAFCLGRWVGKFTKSTCLSFSHWLVVKQFGKCPFCVWSNTIVTQFACSFLNYTKWNDLWVNTELLHTGDNPTHQKKPNTKQKPYPIWNKMLYILFLFIHIHRHIFNIILRKYICLLYLYINMLVKNKMAALWRMLLSLTWSHTVHASRK